MQVTPKTVSQSLSRDRRSPRAGRQTRIVVRWSGVKKQGVADEKRHVRHVIPDIDLFYTDHILYQLTVWLLHYSLARGKIHIIYVCICVCMCKYICVHACMYIHIYMHICGNKNKSIYLLDHLLPPPS